MSQSSIYFSGVYRSAVEGGILIIAGASFEHELGGVTAATVRPMDHK
jgi:hypothetical protein